MATVMVIVLSAAGIWFTIRTKGVQFTMMGEMCRLLFKGDKGLQDNEGKRVSTLEAFSIPPPMAMAILLSLPSLCLKTTNGS